MYSLSFILNLVLVSVTLGNREASALPTFGRFSKWIWFLTVPHLTAMFESLVTFGNLGPCQAFLKAALMENNVGLWVVPYSCCEEGGQTCGEAIDVTPQTVLLNLFQSLRIQNQSSSLHMYVSAYSRKIIPSAVSKKILWCCVPINIGIDVVWWKKCLCQRNSCKYIWQLWRRMADF